MDFHKITSKKNANKLNILNSELINKMPKINKFMICVICNVRKSDSEPGVMYAHFPKDPNRRKLWLYAINDPGLHCMSSGELLRKYVCSRHFNKEDLNRHRLKPDAVPCRQNLAMDYAVNKDVKSELVTLNKESAGDVPRSLLDTRSSRLTVDQGSDRPVYSQTDPLYDESLRRFVLGVLKASVCRLCLCENEELRTVTDGSFVSNVIMCCGVELSESFFYPLKVCNECIVKIDEIIKFREICLQSDSKLRLISKTYSIEQVVGTVQDDVKLQIVADDIMTVLSGSHGIKSEPNEAVTSLGNDDSSMDCPSDGGMIDTIIDVKLNVDSASESIVKSETQSRVRKGRRKATCPSDGRSRRSLKLAMTPNRLGDTDLYEIVPEDTEDMLHLKKTNFRAYIREKSKRICPVCKNMFSTTSTLKYHFYRKHIDGKSYICEQCGRGFVDASYLKKHRLIHNDVKPFLCQHCGHRTRTKREQIIHSRLVHETDAVFPYRCDVCNKSFRTSSSRGRHQRLHENPAPYKCNICMKCFSSKRTRDDHRAAVHMGERNYQCELCPATFGFKEPLRAHRLKVHSMKHTIKKLERLMERERTKTMISSGELQPDLTMISSVS